jgi:hypothetical protein
MMQPVQVLLMPRTEAHQPIPPWASPTLWLHYKVKTKQDNYQGELPSANPTLEQWSHLWRGKHVISPRLAQLITHPQPNAHAEHTATADRLALFSYQMSTQLHHAGLGLTYTLCWIMRSHWRLT